MNLKIKQRRRRRRRQQQKQGQQKQRRQQQQQQQQVVRKQFIEYIDKHFHYNYCILLRRWFII